MNKLKEFIKMLFTSKQKLIAEKDNKIRELSAQIIASDKTIARLKEELAKANNAAQIDSLTNLANRKKISELEYVSPGSSVIICDIDNFKKINDTYGHPFGDRVLVLVGTIIKSFTRGNDYVTSGSNEETDLAVRLGGDEILIVLGNCNAEQAKMKCELIASKIKGAYSSEFDYHSELTLSMGIYFVDEELPLSIAMEAADIALYKSKETKGTITIYDDSLVQKLDSGHIIKGGESSGN